MIIEDCYIIFSSENANLPPKHPKKIVLYKKLYNHKSLQQQQQLS